MEKCRTMLLFAVAQTSSCFRCEKIFSHTRSLESSKNKTVKRNRENRSVSCNKQIPLLFIRRRGICCAAPEVLQRSSLNVLLRVLFLRSLVGQPYK